MPATDVGWERVQAKHNRKFNTNRSASALSNKFKDLYRTKMPTDDPSMPDHIRCAKDIHRDFVERTGGSDGGPGDGNVNPQVSGFTPTMCGSTGDWINTHRYLRTFQ
jgi:hypothetical protein